MLVGDSQHDRYLLHFVLVVRTVLFQELFTEIPCKCAVSQVRELAVKERVFEGRLVVPSPRKS